MGLDDYDMIGILAVAGLAVFIGGSCWIMREVVTAIYPPVDCGCGIITNKQVEGQDYYITLNNTQRFSVNPNTYCGLHIGDFVQVHRLASNTNMVTMVRGNPEREFLTPRNELSR